MNAELQIYAEMSWILESNEAMNRVLRHINAYITKTYAVYEKSLAQPETGTSSDSHC